MSDEFDDVDRTHAPFINSPKAREEMMRIAQQFGLGFTHNPGGGEFYRSASPGWRCQIGTNDDVADLATLRAAVALFHPEART